MNSPSARGGGGDKSRTIQSFDGSKEGVPMGLSITLIDGLFQAKLRRGIEQLYP
jgi:hypothetical protein